MKHFIMLDYDGTLTPVRDHPKLARLSIKRKLFLRKLACRPDIKMAIISGRKLSVVKKLAGIRNIIYAGNHGFEIEIEGKRIIHPAARRFIPILKIVKAGLSAVRRIQGVFIEDKIFTLSVHFRSVPAGRLRYFRKLFFQIMRCWKGKVKITGGKKVFEVRPPVDWDKGKAVKWIIRSLKLRDYLPVYIGDDETDEDAFREIKNKGLTIKVGNSKYSLAKYYLKDVRAVYIFLMNYPSKAIVGTFIK